MVSSCFLRSAVRSAALSRPQTRGLFFLIFYGGLIFELPLVVGQEGRRAFPHSRPSLNITSAAQGDLSGIPGKSAKGLEKQRAFLRLRSWRNSVTIWRFLQLLGAANLVMVVLTHVAEAHHVFPAMGWGQPNTAGHYLDLASAILACTLLPLGFIGSALTRHKKRTDSAGRPTQEPPGGAPRS